MFQIPHTVDHPIAYIRRLKRTYVSLELCYQVVDQQIIEILTTEERVSIGRLHLDSEGGRDGGREGRRVGQG